MSASRGTYSREDFRRIADAVRNWGRWGDDDRIGTLNYITPDRLVAATRLVRRGVCLDLGIPLDANGPYPGTHGRANPIHLMTETGADQDLPGGLCVADDYIMMPLQGATQWDGLAHVFYEGKLYNGFPAADVTPHGAKTLGIEQIGKGVAGRGVLLDVARHQGVDWLEMGAVITPDDLDEVAAAQGVEVESGDILCLRTGWRQKFFADGAHAFLAGEPGIGMATIEWLHEKEIAAIASDNWAIEVLNPTDDFWCGEIEGMVDNVHMILIRDMGMTLGEIFDFDELAADCVADGTWEFFFCGPPLKVTGGVGTPINPLAIK
ncbi:MAG: cyclase family protein [Actinobacteria bacterium]|nr:cyclase family protein [Actinomycetota bacterium]